MEDLHNHRERAPDQPQLEAVIAASKEVGTLPFALVGSVWLLWAFDYNWSVAVAVGLIALAGLAAETGVVMLVYLDEAWHRWAREGRLGARGAFRICSGPRSAHPDSPWPAAMSSTC